MLTTASPSSSGQLANKRRLTIPIEQYSPLPLKKRRTRSQSLADVIFSGQAAIPQSPNHPQVSNGTTQYLADASHSQDNTGSTPYDPGQVNYRQVQQTSGHVGLTPLLTIPNSSPDPVWNVASSPRGSGTSASTKTPLNKEQVVGPGRKVDPETPLDFSLPKKTVVKEEAFSTKPHHNVPTATINASPVLTDVDSKVDYKALDPKVRDLLLQSALSAMPSSTHASLSPPPSLIPSFAALPPNAALTSLLLNQMLSKMRSLAAHGNPLPHAQPGVVDMPRLMGPFSADNIPSTKSPVANSPAPLQSATLSAVPDCSKLPALLSNTFSQQNDGTNVFEATSDSGVMAPHLSLMPEMFKMTSLPKQNATGISLASPLTPSLRKPVVPSVSTKARPAAAQLKRESGVVRVKPETNGNPLSHPSSSNPSSSGNSQQSLSNASKSILAHLISSALVNGSSLGEVASLFCSNSKDMSAILGGASSTTALLNSIDYSEASSYLTPNSPAGAPMGYNASCPDFQLLNLVAPAKQGTCGDKKFPSAGQQKSAAKERRVEANARERNRVHTIGAAFDALRNAVPSLTNQSGANASSSDNGKLSKLSILRVAAKYILLLAAMNGYDYSEDKKAYSIQECITMLHDTLNAESKTVRR